jgi:hypothetical protein
MRLFLAAMTLMAAVVSAAADDIADRRAYAQSYEKTLLRQGLDATVTAGGDAGRVLRVQYPLMGKALAFQISENGKLMEAWRDHGFTRAILLDGFGSSWTLGLKQSEAIRR